MLQYISDNLINSFLKVAQNIVCVIYMCPGFSLTLRFLGGKILSLELSVWCPARALHLVSRAVANLLKSVSQEGESGNLRLNSFEKPIVGQKKAEPGMQQPLQGNGTFYCKSYPSISVSMLLDIIIKDFERAAEVHLATNPITCPQVSTLWFRVLF